MTNHRNASASATSETQRSLWLALGLAGCALFWLLTGPGFRTPAATPIPFAPITPSFELVPAPPETSSETSWSDMRDLVVWKDEVAPPVPHQVSPSAPRGPGFSQIFVQPRAGIAIARLGMPSSPHSAPERSVTTLAAPLPPLGPFGRPNEA